MLTQKDLYDYQKKAIIFQCERPYSNLWIECGLGKTAITLTSIDHLLSNGFLKGVLIVAPLRVIRLVWRQEAAKWSHTQGLTFSLIQGTPAQREAAMAKKADIYLINYENLQWMTTVIKKNKTMPFDGVVYDEITFLKNSQSKRSKAVRKILDGFKWRTGLTGTPSPNGYMDLFGQYLVLDSQRFGTSKTAFVNRFFYQNGPYELKPFEQTPQAIQAFIGDMTLQMSAEDYNPLPDMIINDTMVELPAAVRIRYEEMEKELFLQLDSGEEKEIFNAASLTNACLQLSNGAVYTEEGEYTIVHDAKLDAMAELLEEEAGKPVLCAYTFRSDAERIMERFKHLNPINLIACKTEASLQDAMMRWKLGICPLMIGHPSGISHGIDGLQHNGNIIVWFGGTWSLDLFEQFNARLRRQGQGAPVMCHRILAENTFDLPQAERVEGKAFTQNNLRDAIKQYHERRAA